MIITVTMNPALDKTATLGCLAAGDLNRLSGILQDAGGKGINVSKTIAVLGGKTIATGFLGGGTGSTIEQSLQNAGILCDFVKIAGETRTNLKLVEDSGRVTELNEAGPVISARELSQLTEKLENYASPETIFVLAGSVPRGIDKGIYGTLIQRLKDKGAQVVLDADGELFQKGLSSAPAIVKPNCSELERLYELNHTATFEELISMGKKLLQEGVGLAVISLGSKGAIFLRGEDIFFAPALKVEARSTVGAGDAMVAALTYGLDEKRPLEDCIRLAVATSAGAVTTGGTTPASRDFIESLIPQVIMNRL